MYSEVVNKITRSFYVFTALVITLIARVRAYSFRTCGHEELLSCSKPISGLVDSGLTYFTNKADLDVICQDLTEAVRCIHAYTRLCMNLHQRRHFRKLFHGTSTMVTDLCNNSTFQEEYFKHTSCMEKVNTQSHICFEKYAQDMRAVQVETVERSQIKDKSTAEQFVTYVKRKREAADEGIRSVCCSFQEYVGCNTRTVKRACGEESATFTKYLLDKMSSSMLQGHCQDYTPEKCGIIPSSSTVVSSSVASLSLLTFLVLLFR